MGARVVASGLQAVTLILLARALGATDFGHFAVGLALAYVASAVIGCGGQFRVLRAAAEDDPETVRGALAVVQVGSTAALLVLTSVAGGAGLLDLAFVVGSVLGLSDQVNAFTQADAAGSGEHGHASRMILVQRAIPAGVMLVVFHSFSWTPLVLATAAATAYPAWWLTRRSPWRRFRLEALRGSAGYWTYGLVQTSPQLEAPVVSAVASAATAGMYGIANRVATPLTILSSALSTVFVPEIAATRSAARRHELGRRLVAVSAAYALIVAISAVWIAPAVVWVVGDGFASAQALIAATTVAAGLSAVSQAMNALLIAHGRPTASAVVLGVGTAVSLGGLAVFSSVEQARLLWIAPLVTQVVVLLLFTWALRMHSDRQGTVEDAVAGTA